jgi:hypothetical protein
MRQRNRHPVNTLHSPGAAGRKGVAVIEIALIAGFNIAILPP